MKTMTLPMPRLGETMEQGTIATWLVDVGAAFKRGDPLLELETDKTLVEYPALGSGTLIETLVAPGDVIDVGAPIAIIQSADAWAGIDVAPDPVAEPPETPQAVPRKPSLTKPHAPASGGDKPRATPLARKQARDAEIDLASISGSGRRGRIEARDVHALVASTRPNPDQSRTPGAPGGVLLVHGFAGDRTAWASVEGALTRAGQAVQSIDLPGHGGNDATANDPEDLVSWLAKTLRQQDKPVHLVGHSLGAYVAAFAAAAVPDRVVRLTLIAPAGCGHDINGAFVSGMANATTAGELSHFLRLLGPRAATLSQSARTAMAAELARGRLMGIARNMARGDTQCIDTIAAIAALPDAIPVTALFGMADVIIPKEHVFNMPPRVSVHVLRAGHMPQWDTPVQVGRLLT